MVILGSPSDFKIILNNYINMLSLNFKIAQNLEAFYLSHYKLNLDLFSGKRFASTIETKGFIAHDTDDSVVLFEEGKKIASTWKNAAFNKMRTQGGHSVSAHFKDNKTASILLTAGSDREIKLVYAGEKLPVKTSSQAKVQSSLIGKFQCIKVKLKKGDTLSIGQALTHDKFINVAAQSDKEFHFGLK